MGTITKQLEPIKETPLAAMTDLATAAWGTEEASSEYIKIPYLLLMQKTSALVEKGVAKIGDLVNSTTEEVLGTTGKTVEFIPFFQFKKHWTVRRIEGNKFVKKMPLDVSNKNLPYLDTLDGQAVKNVLCSDFAVLLTRDLKNGAKGFPYIVSFQSTSFGTGRQLETDVLMLRGEHKPIAYFAYELFSEKAKNDKGQSYEVFKLKKIRSAATAELESARQWWATVSQGQVQADDQSLDRSEQDLSQVTENSRF